MAVQLMHCSCDKRCKHCSSYATFMHNDWTVQLLNRLHPFTKAHTPSCCPCPCCHTRPAARSAKEVHQSAVRSAVTGLVTQLAVSNSRLCRLQLSMDGTRLGCLGFSRTGPLGFTEVWEDGPVLRELSVRLAALARSREEVEAARKVGGR